MNVKQFLHPTHLGFYEGRPVYQAYKYTSNDEVPWQESNLRCLPLQWVTWRPTTGA